MVPSKSEYVWVKMTKWVKQKTPTKSRLENVELRCYQHRQIGEEIQINDFTILNK